jgi:hypothetical protein
VGIPTTVKDVAERQPPQLLETPRRLPPPLPPGIEDAPQPRWQRALLVFLVSLELLWLSLIGYTVFWLFSR